MPIRGFVIGKNAQKAVSDHRTTDPDGLPDRF